jgi:hypothetical protein
MVQQSNFKARQSLNKQYAKIKGASSINDVALGFGKGWIVFAVLSAMASAFSFYQDFNQSLGVIISIFLVVILAVALEGFKHLSIKGMFSDMHIVSRSLVSTVAIGLIGISFYTHYKSIQTFQKNLVNSDLKNEIKYQRDLQSVQNGQISSILDTNSELAKALNNGSSSDDKASSASVKSNNELIATLQRLSVKNNMHNSTLLLKQSRATAKTTASAILVIFIMIEIMALFSILSKIIIVDNVSQNVKEFFGLIDRLDELESNTYESLGYQQIKQTEAKINAVQQYQEELHKKKLKQIGTTPRDYLPIEEKNSTCSTLPCMLNNYKQRLNSAFQPAQKEKGKPIIALPENQGVDRVLEQKNSTKKVRALDLKVYDDAEKKLLRVLWDNGNIKIGDNLIPRRLVLKEVGTLKGKSGVLTNLYEKLVDNGYAEFNIRYVAKAELAQQLYQELEE